MAVLVWLTRILFIGSLSVAGERMFYPSAGRGGRRRAPVRANGRYRGRRAREESFQEDFFE